MDGRTNIMTPWTPDGAKMEKFHLILFWIKPVTADGITWVEINKAGSYKIELTALMTLTANEHRIEVFKKTPTTPMAGATTFNACTKDNVILSLHSSAATVIFKIRASVTLIKSALLK